MCGRRGMKSDVCVIGRRSPLGAPDGSPLGRAGPSNLRFVGMSSLGVGPHKIRGGFGVAPSQDGKDALPLRRLERMENFLNKCSQLQNISEGNVYRTFALFGRFPIRNTIHCQVVTIRLSTNGFGALVPVRRFAMRRRPIRAPGGG